MPTLKMYVLVRNDLAEKYRFVQGSHALAQYGLDHNIHFTEWNNSTIVYLAVRNLIEMKAWNEKLYQLEKRYSRFREPDLDDQLTSIACYDSGLIFKELSLA